jgi:farnesyl diphosphate synthase
MMTTYLALQKKIKDYSFLVNEKINLLIQDKSLIEQAMRYSVLASGKRIRPFLFLATLDVLDGNIEESIDIAATIEIVHTYSLIHDDLPAMDNANYRRGQPTCHKKYDEATAILAGDALLTYAFEIISKNQILSPKTKCDLLAMLAHAIGYQGMIKGQMLDMQACNNSFNLKKITELQQLKTGKLLSFCCQAAAIICDAKDNQITALQNYSEKLGLLFQITDDLLDYEGESYLVGKDLQQDQTKGKSTFISLLGINQAKKLVEKLKNEAINSLTILNKTSDLIQLAEFISIRKN